MIHRFADVVAKRGIKADKRTESTTPYVLCLLSMQTRLTAYRVTENYNPTVQAHAC